MREPIPADTAAPAAPPPAQQLLVGLAAAVIVIAGLSIGRDLIGLVLLALVATIAVQPLRRALVTRLPPWAAGAITLVVVYLTLALLAAALVASVTQFTELVIVYQQQLSGDLESTSRSLIDGPAATRALGELLTSLEPSQLLRWAESLAASTLSAFSGLALLLALLLFMITDSSQLPALLSQTRQQRPTLLSALSGFGASTRRYLWVSTVFGFAVAVLDTIALLLLGIPAAPMWGLLALLTNYIPNVGFVIGLIPPALLALLSGGPWLALAVVGIYCVLNVVVQTVIQPKVVGDAVGLSATLTFISLVAWAAILGPLGALLAIPLTLLVKALFVDADPRARWLLPLISGRPRSSPDATSASQRRQSLGQRGNS